MAKLNVKAFTQKLVTANSKHQKTIKRPIRVKVGNHMAKTRVGNKENSAINREYAGHVRGWLKRFTSKKRRRLGKADINKQQSDEL